MRYGAEQSTAKGLIYSFGVCQLVVMAGMVLFFPVVGIETYVFTPAVENGTLIPGEFFSTRHGEIHHVKLLMGLPCLATSISVTGFVSMTYSLTEAGLLGDDVYTKEQLQNEGCAPVWDAVFWLVVTLVHSVAAFAVATPVDVFAGCSCVYLMTHFLHRICQPTDAESTGPNMAMVSGLLIRVIKFWLTLPYPQANVNIVGYTTGFLLMIYCAPASYTNRYTVAFVLGVLDYFLCIRHTWDRAPKMVVVSNCRLFWACSCSLCMAGLYGAWHDELLVQFTSH